MKKKASEGSLKGLMKKGQQHNKDVNSDNFKRKSMERSKSWFPYNSDLSLNENYSRYQSIKNTRPEGKVVRALKNFQELDGDLQSLFLAVYPLDSIVSLEHFSEKAFKLYWGLRTTHYSRREPKGSVTNFKAETLSNLKHNLSKANGVYVRSSYEANYVKFFEANHIPWDYERYTILSLSKEHHYTPDFYIEYKGKKYIIEVKGSMSFYSDALAKEYIEDKIAAAKIFCREKGYRFIFTFRSKPDKDMKFLEDDITEEIMCS